MFVNFGNNLMLIVRLFCVEVHPSFLFFSSSVEVSKFKYVLGLDVTGKPPCLREWQAKCLPWVSSMLRVGYAAFF